MARLRNRQVKAEFWTDGELLRWPLAKRHFYQGLWALAEDSGCLEDDTFTWKLQLFPSPLDADVSIERLEQWRDELVACGKLRRYEAAGKRYLYLTTFHDHEAPRNPQRADLPLPRWLKVLDKEGVSADGKRWTRCRYMVDDEHATEPADVCTDNEPSQTEGDTDSVQTPYKLCTDSVPSPQSRPVPSRSVPLGKALATRQAKTSSSPDAHYSAAFLAWWEAFGHVGSKADASALYEHWRQAGTAEDDLLHAARSYRAHCEAAGQHRVHARTFLAKKPNRWREWVDEEHETGVAPDKVRGRLTDADLDFARSWAKAHTIDPLTPREIGAGS